MWGDAQLAEAAMGRICGGSLAMVLCADGAVQVPGRGAHAGAPRACLADADRRPCMVMRVSPTGMFAHMLARAHTRERAFVNAHIHVSSIHPCIQACLLADLRRGAAKVVDCGAGDVASILVPALQRQPAFAPRQVSQLPALSPFS